jgi:hypothetical protein
MSLTLVQDPFELAPDPHVSIVQKWDLMCFKMEAGPLWKVMEVSIPKVHPTVDFFMKIALKHKKIPKGAAISKNSIKNKDSKPSNRWHGKFFFCAP